MKKLAALFGLALIIGCGPSEKSPWPFYELVYSTTLSAHNSEQRLQETLTEYVKLKSNDSVMLNAGLYQAVLDSNAVIISRIEESINVLNNAPDGNEYKDAISMAIDMLQYQKMYHANAVSFVIECGKDSMLTTEELSMFVGWNETHRSLEEYYGKWKLYRDEFISDLELSDADQQSLAAKYGKD